MTDASTQIAVASTEIVVPVVGELVNLDDYQACAKALDAIRDLEQQLREAKAELSRAVAYQASRQGVKSLPLNDGRTAIISGGVKVDYDAEQMETGLRNAGMPEERIREIVVEEVTYKVKAVEARRAAAANAEYAYVIDQCRRETEEPPRVSLRRH